MSISTVATFDHLQYQRTGTEVFLNNASLQSSSGLKGATFDALGSNTRAYLGGTHQLTVSKGYEEANTRITARLKTMDQANSKLINIGRTLLHELTLAMNPTNNQGSFIDITADQYLTQAGSILNVKLDDEYLFAGSMTSTEPVNINAVGAGTVPSTTYYVGDQEIRDASVSENYVIDYGIKADESGYEKLLRALKQASLSGNDRAKMGAAADLVREAVSEMADIGGRIGTSINQIESVEVSHEEENLENEKKTRELAMADMALALTNASLAALQMNVTFGILSQFLQGKRELIRMMG